MQLAIQSNKRGLSAGLLAKLYGNSLNHNKSRVDFRRQDCVLCLEMPFPLGVSPKPFPFRRRALSTSSNSEKGDAAQPTTAVEVVGTCTLGKSTTPMRLHLREHFSNLLEKKREKTVNRGDKCKAKPQFYGVRRGFIRKDRWRSIVK